MRIAAVALAVFASNFFVPAAIAQTANAEHARSLDGSPADLYEAGEKRVLAEKIVASRERPGREIEPRLRRRMIARLRLQPLDQLREQLTSGMITPMAVGDTQADLTYTTFAQPCRIADTRLAVGPLSPGITRNLQVAGTDGFELQGGKTGGCGVPVGSTAVLINLVAVNPVGAGNLRGSAYGTLIPTTGSIINYAALTPNLNIANALQLPICDPESNPPCAADLSLQANGAGTHLVADVLGYFQRFPVERVKSFIVEKAQAVGEIIGTTCAPVSGASITIDAPVAGKINVRVNVLVEVWDVGASNSFVVAISTSSGVCTDGWFGWEKADVAVSVLPNGPHNVPYALNDVIDVLPGETTIYLNAQGYVGTNTGILNAYGFAAEFIPD